MTCLLSRKSRSLSWNLKSQSVGFKIDVPWTSIRQLTFNGPTAPSLSEQQEGILEPLGILCVTLNRPPTFFMETFRSSVRQDGEAGEGDFNRWRQCDDFTEAKQGTYILTHLISGRYLELRQAVIEMAGADPDLAAKLTMRDVPSSFQPSANQPGSMQRQQSIMSSYDQSPAPPMIRQESYRSATSLYEPSPQQNQRQLLPSGFEMPSGFAASPFTTGSQVSMDASPFSTASGAIHMEQSMPTFTTDVGRASTGAVLGHGLSPSSQFGGALCFDTGVEGQVLQQQQPQSSAMMPSMTQPIPEHQRPQTMLQRRSYDHYLQQQRQTEERPTSWFNPDGTLDLSLTGAGAGVDHSGKRHSDSVLLQQQQGGSSWTEDPTVSMAMPMSPLVASFGGAALAPESSSRGGGQRMSSSMIKSSLDGAVGPSSVAMEGGHSSGTTATR